MAEYVFLNDSALEDEGSLGATNVFASFEEAQRKCEYWVAEERGMRFYDVHGERLIAVDHGNQRTFHLERAGTFFTGFEDLIRQEAERSGVAEPESGFSVEHVLRTIWQEQRTFEQENRGCLAWLLPPKHFQKKYGFWSWYFPSLRKEPPGIVYGRPE